MADELTGHVAVVTGASRGIGAGIATALARAGAAVVVNFKEREEEAAATAEGIRRGGGRAMTVRADVSVAEDVARMFEQVTTAFGPVDILVNNAGIAVSCSIEDLTEETFDETIAVNLKSTFLCTQATIPAMRARQWGRIVNVSSGAARGAGAIGPHYNASKAGVEGLTRAYAALLVNDGVTVNAVSPSLIETDMTRHLPELVDRIPLGRLGRVEEVAQAVLLLVTNAYMTGQTVAMSGGMSFN